VFQQPPVIGQATGLARESVAQISVTFLKPTSQVPKVIIASDISAPTILRQPSQETVKAKYQTSANPSGELQTLLDGDVFSKLIQRAVSKVPAQKWSIWD